MMRRGVSRGLSLGAVLGIVAFVGCSLKTEPSNIICVPDQSNVCTDCPPKADPEDKASYAGRHVCAHDGRSFGPCEQCAPVVSSGKFNEVPHEPPPPSVDGGVTLPPAADTIDASCAGKLALLAGNEDRANTFSYAAVYQGTSFKVFSATGAPMRSPAAFTTSGTSVIAIYRSKNDAIVTTTFSGGLWSAPAGIPGASSDGPPALTTWGTTVKAVFRQDDGYHHVANYEPATGWATAIELVGSTATPPPPGITEPSAVSFGAPGLSGAAVMVGYADNAKGLYRQEWKNNAWRSQGIKATTVQSSAFRPQIIVMTAGAFDLISTYVTADGILHYATRTSEDSATLWSADLVANAKVIPGGPVNGVGLTDGRALVVYRDADKKGRFTVFDPKKTPNWSDPKPLLDEDPPLASTPQLVRDPCGADASLSLALAEGPVAVMRFTKDAWKGPYIVEDVPTSTYATVVATP